MNFRLPGKGFFSPSVPSVPAVRDIPTVGSEDAERSRKEAVARARKRRGLGTSRLTNPLGDNSEAPVRRQTLGGA